MKKIRGGVKFCFLVMMIGVLVLAHTQAVHAVKITVETGVLSQIFGTLTDGFTPTTLPWIDIGDWQIFGLQGRAAPPFVPSPGADAELISANLGAQNIRGGANPNDLTITIEHEFAPLDNPNSDDIKFWTQFGGTTNNQVSYETTQEYENSLGATVIETLGPWTLGSGSFSIVPSVAFLIEPAFSSSFLLTQVITISHSDINQISQFTATSAKQVVPEPSTVLLLGIGIFGLIGLGRKRFLK